MKRAFSTDQNQDFLKKEIDTSMRVVNIRPFSTNQNRDFLKKKLTHKSC